MGERSRQPKECLCRSPGLYRRLVLIGWDRHRLRRLEEKDKFFNFSSRPRSTVHGALEFANTSGAIHRCDNPKAGFGFCIHRIAHISNV